MTLITDIVSNKISLILYSKMRHDIIVDEYCLCDKFDVLDHSLLSCFYMEYLNE